MTRIDRRSGRVLRRRRRSASRAGSGRPRCPRARARSGASGARCRRSARAGCGRGSAAGSGRAAAPRGAACGSSACIAKAAAMPITSPANRAPVIVSNGLGETGLSGGIAEVSTRTVGSGLSSRISSRATWAPSDSEPSPSSPSSARSWSWGRTSSICSWSESVRSSTAAAANASASSTALFGRVAGRGQGDEVRERDRLSRDVLQEVAGLLGRLERLLDPLGDFDRGGQPRRGLDVAGRVGGLAQKAAARRGAGPPMAPVSPAGRPPPHRPSRPSPGRRSRQPA